MRRYDIVEVKERRLTGCRCDICDKDLLSDDMEGQEAFSFNAIGGYTSVFGDGAEISIDLCQHCFKDKLGNYCTII
jgi:hypothetical protein